MSIDKIFVVNRKLM